ncbi:Putative methyltransferase NSUN6 [Galdieria sulphuraria]|nr:Putative methyltransferase NSUN6 [Galdieria sulphuraria]
MFLIGRLGFILWDKKVYKDLKFPYPKAFIWRQGTIRSFVTKAPTSANGIVDPYDPSLEWKPWYVDVTKRILASLRDVQAMAVMQKQIGRFKVKEFKEEAFQIYRQVNEAFAAGNKKLLFQYTTPLTFKEFCIALDGRPPLEKHVWKLGKLVESQVITLRLYLSRALGVYNSKGDRIYSREVYIF